MAANTGKSSSVSWLASSSGETRKQLIIIESMLAIDAFGGRLCDLLGGVGHRLKACTVIELARRLKDDSNLPVSCSSATVYNGIDWTDRSNRVLLMTLALVSLLYGTIMFV